VGNVVQLTDFYGRCVDPLRESDDPLIEITSGDCRGGDALLLLLLEAAVDAIFC
jgi:hypothetical protein